MEKKRFSEDYSSITINEINKAAKKIVEMLNMQHGSVGGFDIYILLQSYFRDIEKREEINKLLQIPDSFK